MSANLSIDANGKAEMFSGESIVPWHKLGTVVAGLATAREAIEHAHLNWPVTKEGVFDESGTPIVGYNAIVRDDPRRVLSIMKGRYHIIQNADAFDFFDEIIGAGEAVYETAGALDEGRRVWIQAKLDGEMFIDSRPDEKIERQILLVTSHDGTSSLMVQHVATRVVCQNTLSAAMRQATNQVKIRHTKSYKDKLAEAQRVLKLTKSYYGDLNAVLNEMAKREVDAKELRVFVDTLIPRGEDDSKRKENMRDEVITLFSRGKGNRGESRFDALNAVTEFVDHHRSTRVCDNGDEFEARFSSALFGSGNTLKNRAFDLLTSDLNMGSLVAV